MSDTSQQADQGTATDTQDVQPTPDAQPTAETQDAQPAQDTDSTDAQPAQDTADGPMTFEDAKAVVEEMANDLGIDAWAKRVAALTEAMAVVVTITVERAPKSMRASILKSLITRLLVEV